MPIAHGSRRSRLLDTSFLLCVMLVLGGCATPGDLLSSLPVPQEVNVVAPAADLAPQVAGFWGIWEGIWRGPHGLLPSRLIVEQIDAESAQVVYVWGDDPRGQFKAGWGRFEAKVRNGRVLEFGWLRTRMVFEMAENGRSLEGGRVQGRDVSAILMRKVAP